MPQCAKFLKNEERQCKRNTTTNSKFCYQHKRKVNRKTKTTDDPTVDHATDAAVKDEIIPETKTAAVVSTPVQETSSSGNKIPETHLQFLNEKYAHWDSKVDPHALTAQRLLSKRFTHQDLTFQNEKVPSLTEVNFHLGQAIKTFHVENDMSIMDILNFLHENHELVNEMKGLTEVNEGKTIYYKVI